MKKLLAVSAFLSFAVGCAPTYSSMKVALNPGGELEVITAEPDWRTIIVVGVVRDDAGKIAGVVPGQGITKAEIIFNGAQTATTVAMPFVLGHAIVKAAGKIKEPVTTVNIDTSSGK